MSKTRDELKAKRARYVVWLEEQTDALRRLRDKFHEDEKISEDIIADYHAELADLDRAIAALTPAPAHEGVAEVEVPDALAEFMKREGAVKVASGEFIEVGLEPRHWLYSNGHTQTCTNPIVVWGKGEYHGNIIAYAPVISEPASSPQPAEGWDALADKLSEMSSEDAAKVLGAMHPGAPEGYAPVVGEGEAAVYGYELAYRDGSDARIENVPIECNPYDGKEAEHWNEGWNEADATIRLNEPATPDPLSISASETHAAESDAVKGDLPPLFPPEPPKAATVEELAEAGIINGDAYWLSRKIAKEMA